MHRPLASFLALALCASGCYRAHTNGEAGVSETGIPDSGRRETGTFPSDVTHDTRRDTEPPVGCRADDECPPPVAECGRAFCSFDLRCGVVEIPGACPFDSICDLTRGCVPNPFLFDGGPDTGGTFFDVSLPDASGFEAGLPDAFSFDAGRPDAGRPDAAPFDAASFDTGLPDSPPPDAFRPDAFSGDAGPPPISSAIRCSDETVLRIPSHTQLNFGPTGTLELWVRARAPGTIAVKGTLAGAHYFHLRIEGTGADAVILGGWGVGTVEQLVSAPFGAQMNRWTHVALVQRDLGDTVSLGLFLDGVLVSTMIVPDDFAATMNSLPFRMCTLDADLDEIRLWRAARDETSIVADLRRMLPSGIVALSAYWPLEERGQIALDRSLHGADGVLGETSDVERADPMRIPDGAF